MMRLSIERFGGEAPRLADRLLPDHMASAAINCKLTSGELRPFAGMSEVARPGGDAPLQTIHLYDGNHWLAFTKDVDLVRGPVPGDRLGRLYHSGLGAPGVSDAKKLARGQLAVDVIPGVLLGAPAPDRAPTIYPGGDPALATGSAAYLCTLVNEYGEEGPPSPASATVERYDGRPMTIANLEWPPARDAADHAISKRRLYRTATPSAGSAVWRFVTEIPAKQASAADVKRDVDLGESLSSAEYAPPPADLAGVTALPGGVLAGFSGNQLCFSEPFLPHAWPARYRLSTDYPIRALGLFGTTLVAATGAYPYLVSGGDPASMSMSRLQDPQPCVSKRSMAASEFGAVFATDDGLFMAGPAGASRVTKSLFTREDWQRLNPGSMHGAMHDGLYVAFFQPREDIGVYGMMLDPLDPQAGVVFLDFYADALVSEQETGQLYLAVRNGGVNRIMQWEGDASSTLPFRWRSRPFVIPGPVNLGALAVQGDYPTLLSEADAAALNAARESALTANQARLADPAPLGGAMGAAALHVHEVNGGELDRLPPGYAPPDPLHVAVEADGRDRAAHNMRSNAPARLPAGYTAREWTVTVSGSMPVQRVMLGASIRDLTE